MVAGDIVVMGTDGVFDNVYDADIEPCLLKHKAAEDRANCIGEKAYANGKDRSYLSPFAKGARDAGRWY